MYNLSLTGAFMRNIDQWLSEYGESHQNRSNKMIHLACVPAIEFSALGILWLIPTPSIFWNIPFLNWATIFCILIISFYISLRNISYLLGSTIMILTMLFIINSLKQSYGGVIIYLFFGVFILAWIAQFIGHRIEGKRPSFFKDLFFLLIGPLWVLKYVYMKLGLTKTT